jgi:predicted nuclease of predicted toxin-antitoxin system
MVYAVSNGFVIPTNDLDFGVALATTNKEKPSVV